MALLYLTQGMSKPYLRLTFSDKNGIPVNITGSTVTFSMQRIGDTSLKVNRQPVNVDNPAQGLCHYEWNGTDLDTPGSYHGWGVITFPDGTTQPTNVMGFDVLPFSAT